MDKLLCARLQPGVAVHFPCKIRAEVSNDNLYAIKLRYPTISHDESGSYKDATCIFTEKELNRATVRYYSECDEATGELAPTCTVNKPVLGYVGTRTYINKSGVITTRFIIRFDGHTVPDLYCSNCLGLFTARELRRSQDRAEWVVDNRTVFWKRCWRKLTRRR